jgi:hypothetical protein
MSLHFDEFKDRVQAAFQEQAEREGRDTVRQPKHEDLELIFTAMRVVFDHQIEELREHKRNPFRRYEMDEQQPPDKRKF